VTAQTIGARPSGDEDEFEVDVLIALLFGARRDRPENRAQDRTGRAIDAAGSDMVAAERGMIMFAAAKEISSLDEAERQFQEAAAVLKKDAEGGKVKVLVDENHIGSKKQARGIEPVAGAVNRMQQVTQSNAEELSGQAETLPN